MANKAVFLDRDGTLNKEIGFAKKKEDYERLPGVVEGLKILMKLGFKLIVVTSQSGVARGFYTEKEVHEFHDHLTKDLEKEGVKIDAFYFCPHHATQGIGKYKVECDCRKPKTGMIDKAVKDFEIDTKKSYMIGDKDADIMMGKAAGCTSIFVKTGTNKNLQGIAPDYTAENLHDAAKWIKKKEESE